MEFNKLTVIWQKKPHRGYNFLQEQVYEMK